MVATASLELGIDIGTVDLVCQIGSPRSIAVALQRVGRAGHWVGALPKGRLFATTRDELIECAALVRAIRRGELDRLEIPQAPLDILAQQIVAMSACEEFAEDDLFALVRRAYPYRDLDRADFDAVVDDAQRGHRALARAQRGISASRSGESSRARPARRASGGDHQRRRDSGYRAVSSDRRARRHRHRIARRRLRHREHGRRRVPAGDNVVENSSRRDRDGCASTMRRARRRRFRSGWAKRRGARASCRKKSRRCGKRLPEAGPLGVADCGLDQRGAEQAVEYVRAGFDALGAMPTQDTVVAERFFDEAGGMQLVIHSPFGARINKAWGLALRKRFCRTFNFELQAAATDNGIVLSLSDQHSFPLDLVFSFLKPATVEHVLTQAMFDAPMFGARWKWNAARALAIPRFSGGRKVPPPIQRMRSDDLLASVFPDQVACAENLTGEIRIPDHPLVKETIDNCLHEAMDIEGLKEILERMGEGTLRTVAVDTREPSPFSHELLNANPYAFLDDAPLEERRTRAVQMRRSLSVEDAKNLGTLDPAAIAQVAEESWPVVRDEHELHDALLTLIVLPPVRKHGASGIDAGTRRPSVHGQRTMGRDRASGDRAQPADEAATAAVLRGWLDSIGPITPAALAARLSLPQEAIDIALAKLESEGLILRGRFSSERRRVLSPPRSGPHSSHDAGPPAKRDRAGDCRRLHAISRPLAASRAGNAAARSRRTVSGPAPAAGLRDFGGGMGIERVAAARRQLRSGTARPLVPVRRNHVGAAFAASGA